ncbi:ParB-like partition protein [Gordonia phage Sour]|uniref:ParB-like nuclease domain protein n=1 Tax=Gordonia phage Sour TaxID=2182349 RepID=A0A2U8UKQ2_9CAUD|nr:ParB-like partition protein [Gordonia phage Sour]AWN04203.1 ParB-like nuclease domain protein [Gordonia phage Sour]
MASKAAPTSVSPSDLNTYHRNARRGDVATIAGSLKAHGQYRPIVVNKGTHTGRPNEVLAGNHTLMAIRDLAESYPDDERWASVLVHWLDVDDDRCRRIVLADNRTAEKGSYDHDLLFELVDSLGGDLDGTGYTDADLEMLSDLANGPTGLDDLADEYGDPTEEDGFAKLKLDLSPIALDAWNDHRKGYSDDSRAMLALLDGSAQ